MLRRLAGAMRLGARMRSAVEQLAIALQLADENLYRAKRQGRNASVARGGDYANLATGRFRHEP